MTNWSLNRSVGTALAVAVFALAGLGARATTCSWTNALGGNWSNANNWSPNQVPGAADTAVITNAGNYTVSLNVSATVAGFTLGGSDGLTQQGFLTGSQTLVVNGPIQVDSQGNFNLDGGALSGTSVVVGTLTWSGGSLAGVLTLASNSVLNIVAGGGDGFNGLTLTNYGTVNWTNTTLEGIHGGNAAIYNYGLWNAQSDNTFQGGINNGTSQFYNYGTFLKSGSTNSTVLDGAVIFNNSGTVEVASGGVSVNAGTSSGGGFATAGGATVSLAGYGFTGTTTFSGSGGYVVGNATFAGTIAGTLGWAGGILNGALTVATNSFFNIGLGGAIGEFNGLTITNYGTVNWTNTTLQGVNGQNAAIYNYGLWNAQSDNTFQGGINNNTSLFNNYGTFLKSGNAGATVLDGAVVFNNSGTVTCASGMLAIEGGGVNSGGGTFTTANGGLLSLDNLTFANSAKITSGTVVDLGGSTTINGVLTATNLQLVGGQLGGNNTIVGTLTWSGGSLAGVLTLASNSVMNIVAGGGDGFNGLTLTNYGTVNWTNATLEGIHGGNAAIYNYGLWNAQSDNTFQGGINNGTSQFYNYGTLLKSGNSGTTIFDAAVVFYNSGTVEAASGALDLEGGGTGSNADFVTSGTGAINIYGYTFDGSTTFSGPGSYVAGGLAAFAGTIAGTLNWDGGSLTGAATLVTNGIINIVAGGGDGFDGLTLTNYGTVNWTNTTLKGINGYNATIYNFGLWNAQSDNTFQGGVNNNTTLFENFGTFLKSGSTNSTVLDGAVIFNNSGTVEVASGGVSVNAGTSSGGGFETAGGATVSLAGYGFTSTTTFNGSGGYVVGNATFAGTIAGTLGWAGGILNGALTVATNSFFNIGLGGAIGEFNGLTITNYGTVNWTNTTLQGVNTHNAAIYNYGLWNAQSDNTFQGGVNNGTSLFDNYGTFLKSGNAGATVLDGAVVFNNSGTVTCASGTLAIEGGGVNSGGGTFTTANGGLLSLDNLTFANSAKITSATVVDLGGSTTINGVLTATNLQLVGGELEGNNTIVGTLTWSGGSLAGVLTLASNSVMNIVAGGGDGFNGLTLTNYGTVNWTNTTLQGVNNHNAAIYNYGLWNAQSDNTFQGGINDGISRFYNYGTLLKSGNSGTTIFDAAVVFYNSGTVEAASGALDLEGGGTGSNADFVTSGTGAINIYGYTFDGSTTFSGPGSYVAGGLAAFAGTIAGTLNWDGGSLTGAATLVTNGTINIVAGGGDGFNGLTLTNYGTVNWTNTTLQGINGNNAVIYNYGLWNAQSDNEFYGGVNNNTTLFENFGTFLKSGSTNSTVLDGAVIFNNSGTVEVASGGVSVNAGTSSGGGFETAGGATVSLAGYGFTSTTTFNGSGGYVVGNATFAGTIAGTLGWAGGILNGALTVATNSFFNIGLGGAIGEFNGLTITNYGTVNWTNTPLNGVNSRNAAIYNYGLWNAQSDNTFQGGVNNGTSLFNNYGTFLKSGNAGTTVLDGAVVFNNTGTLDVEQGTLRLSGNYNLAANNFVFGINSSTNYGSLSLAGTEALAGTVTLNFNNDFVPTAGSQFPILSCASLTGNFTVGRSLVGESFTYSSTTATLVWNGFNQATWSAGNAAFHGTGSESFLVNPGNTVELVASAGGLSYVLGTTTGSGLNAISFNTGQLPNGRYTLEAIVRNAAGQVVADVTRSVFVNNTLAWHEGTLLTSQTWGTNVVNAVDQNVIIPSGVTLTLAPGAIVKFTKGTGIIVEAGGVLNASGATEVEPVILTSIADDSAGGDSNEDGDASVPVVGDWDGVSVSGQFNANSFVQIRYVIQTHSGTLTANQEWFGSIEHLVTGNITIPTNVTLTIDPGAIIKMELGTKFTVQSGGSLVATGTIAQPIVLTSINDGSVGADTNAVATSPLAGDWDSIYLTGGQATFTYVTLEYGGGPDSLNSGLISLTAPGSVATISDSILNDAFYKGINAEYGTINVTNCLITGCDRGIQSGLDGPTLASVVNCTLDDNNYGLLAHGGIMDVANTIVADSLTAGVTYCCGSTLAEFEYCDVWSGLGVNYSGVADLTGVNGNIEANPEFVNAAQGDYELNYGSPAIDAADGTLATLTDLTGAPRYNDPRVLVKTGITNAIGVYPDMGAFEFVETASSTVDLIVGAVSGPSSETAGQTVTVQWNDVNIGSGAATGPWHDTISLAPQNGGDPVVAATVLVAQNTVLGPGQSYAASASVVVPASEAGMYQWQVHVNSQGDVFEGVNWTNNITLDDVPTTLSVPELSAVGPALTNVFSAPGQSFLYEIVPQAGQNELVTLSLPNGGGAVELFLAQGYAPTPEQFDSQQSQWNSSVATLLVPGNSQQPYYVLVYAESLSNAPATYTLTAQPASFTLSGVSPTVVGNAGSATLTILGGQLTNGLIYQVVDPNGTSHNATAVTVQNASEVFATFDFTGLPLGAYSLQIAGTAAVLPAAILVSNLPPGTVTAQITGPPLARVGTVSILTLDYNNAGGSDVAAPLLFVESGAPEATLQELLAGQTVTDVTSNEDDSWDPGYSEFRLPGNGLFLPQIQLLGINQNGPAGTLPPGYHGQIQIEMRSSPLNTTDTGSYSVSVADPSDVVNWNALEAEFQPFFQSAEAWAAVWLNFTAKVGATYGAVQAEFDQDATHLAALGDSTFDVRRLMAFEFEQADDNGAITARSRLGAFGRGLPDPTDFVAVDNSAGLVAIIAEGTFAHLFYYDTTLSSPVYTSQPGDYATLVKVGGVFQLREPNGLLDVFGASGQVNYVQDPNGNRTTFNYSGGQMTGFTESDGDTTTYTYDGNGRITATTDPEGRTTSYMYDAADEHVLQISNADGTIGLGWITGQGPIGDDVLASITNADGTHNYFQYDAQGRLVLQTSDGGAEPLGYTYDGFGGVTVTNAVGRAWNMRPNEFLHLLQAQGPLGLVISSTYDDNQNLTTLKNSVGQATRFTYDSGGNPVTGVDPLGFQLTGAYDLTHDQLTSLTDPLGHTLSMQYDTNGNLIADTYPYGAVDTYYYDAAGNPTTWTDRRGLTTGLAYDSRNLPIGLALPDGSGVAYAYDAHRNLITASNSTGLITFGYDTGDHLTNVAYPNGRFLQFTYDAVGRRASMTDQDGFTTRYGYDSLGRLALVSDAASNTIVAYTYDATGLLARKNLGNGNATIYTYTSSGLLQSLVNQNGAGTVLSSFDYTYDAVGNVQTMTTLAGTFTYAYDLDNQLVSVAAPGGRTLTYQYDAAGNRATVVDTGTNTAYAANALNQYTAAGTASYVYDADGNLVSKADASGTTTWTYDGLDRVVAMNSPSTGSWTYEYDALGQRSAVTHNGQREEYLFDPLGLGDVVGEYQGGGGVVAHYTHGLGLASRVDGTGAAAFYDFDLNGNTVDLTDPSGALLNSYSYLPFGEKLSTTGSTPNPFTYVGQLGVQDGGEGLYFMRRRWYDPAVGRFTQSDPTGLNGGDANLYRYVANSPAAGTDPNGTAKSVGEQLLNGVNQAWDNYSGLIPDKYLFIYNFVNVPLATYNLSQDINNHDSLGTVHDGAILITQTIAIIPISPETPPALIPVIIVAQNAGKIDKYSKFAFNHFWESYYYQSPADDWGPRTWQLKFHRLSSNATRRGKSGDPNDKSTVGFGPQGFVIGEDPLEYTIDFQNEPTATLPAQEVVVTDQLAATLDWSTFELQTIAFNNVTINVPAGLQSYTTEAAVATDPNPVQVSAALNPVTGVVTWTMKSIDPVTGELVTDPLAGFLPPDTTNGIGEGYVTYSVQPASSLATGTVITNVASIVFDENAPILTPTTTNTIDDAPPVSSMVPLPALSAPNFVVAWSGTDVGSGIANYDIYVSTNGGPWVTWLSDTTNTTALFNGSYSNSYAFYSQAYDLVGNAEVAPVIPGASTTVSPIRLTITRSGNGSLTLTWPEGTLLQSSSLAGPWTTNAASSPYTFVPITPVQFYRVLAY